MNAHPVPLPIAAPTNGPRNGHSTIARALLVFATACLTLLIAACGRPHDFNGTVYDPVIAAPEITGTNWDGTPFHLSDLRGKVVLLFFGYTSCPDICPTNVADMKAVRQSLGAAADDVAVVFVSVDPERDTLDRLGAYMRAFDPSFYGVSVPADQLEAIKKGYGVFSQKHVVDPAQSDSNYLIDHTAWTYAIDKKGNLRLIFSLDLTTDQRASDVAYLIGR